MGTYLLGTAVATGIYNPIKYINNLIKIEGSLIDIEIRYDSRVCYFNSVLKSSPFWSVRVFQNWLKCHKNY